MVENQTPYLTFNPDLFNSQSFEDSHSEDCGNLAFVG